MSASGRDSAAVLTGCARVLAVAVALGGCGGEPAPVKSPEPAPAKPVPTAAKPAPAEPTAEQAAGQNECPEGMQSIPGGTLWMGSPEGRGRADERPRHKLSVQPFCLDAREVTVEAYQACVRNTICAAPTGDVQLLEPKRQSDHEARSRSCTSRLADNATLPMNCIGHDQALQYCSWKGRRLPSEAEWEWAATGGDDALDYGWGSTPPRDDVVCWQAKRACNVGSRPAESFGLFDLGGNVSEWTATPYGPYPSATPDAKKLSVRGGSFADTEADALRSRRRDARLPAFRDITLGFRCAKSL